MSSAPVPPNPTSDPATEPAPAFPSDTGTRATERIVVYRHSNLFYWWLVWLLGFVFAAVTYFDNKHLAIVPADTIAAENRQVDVDGKGHLEHRNVLILEKGKKLWERTLDDGTTEIVQPTIFMPHYKSLGSV